MSRGVLCHTVSVQAVSLKFTRIYKSIFLQKTSRKDSLKSYSIKNNGMNNKNKLHLLHLNQLRPID